MKTVTWLKWAALAASSLAIALALTVALANVLSFGFTSTFAGFLSLFAAFGLSTVAIMGLSCCDKFGIGQALVRNPFNFATWKSIYAIRPLPSTPWSA